ncbi:uncharacterized protein LOC114721849 isoform X2 [Neltuma alba]|uniref:uncharacterized protein LOC114721849 isoform X2 n=1 Tax=Neltuma alba TaxID=207710 RepID=UPI0010A51F53|nr:uncharacterized protein LOC114721849 isoform X2 [Prosopis alba]
MTSSVVSNDNLSALPKGAFSTQSSTPNLAIHPDEHSLDSVMRQSQVENVSIEKSEHENALDKSQIMTSVEVSLRKERRRKKRREKGHDAIESNDHLSAVVKDAFSTETSTAAAPPTHLDEHSLDSVMRQAQVENASKEKNVLENYLDKSQIMSGKEVSLKKRRKRKRQEKGNDATKSNDNLSAVLKDALSTETSKAALAVPPTHSDEHSLHSVTRKSQVENASKDQNVLENYLDKSQIMSGKEVSLKKRRKRKRQEKGHDATKSNDNLSAVLKDALSTETSKAALAVPPTHSDEHSLDSVTRKAQVENASKDQNVLENYLDKSQIMSGKEVSLKKRRKGKRQEKGHDATKSNDNLSAALDNALSTETSKAALALPPTHSDEHSLDSAMRRAQVENVSKDKNVLENSSDKSQIMLGTEVRLKKREGRKKRKEKGHDATKRNGNLSAVPKDAFSIETSTAALAGPPTHLDEHSLDSLVRQSQVENASNEKNVLENASDKSQIATSVAVGSRNKRKREKRRGKGYDASESNVNKAAVPKDTLSVNTSAAAMDLPPLHSVQYPMSPVMRLSREANEEVQNIIGKATDGPTTVANEKVSLRKKNKKRKRRKTGCNDIGCVINHFEVPKDTFAPDLVMSQCQEENQGKDQNMVEKATDGSLAMPNAEVNPRKKNKRMGKRRKTRHDSLQSNVNLSGVSKGDISHSTVVSKHGHSKVSHSSLGRAISSYPKKKLLVLDLNGLLADFVLGVPEGYKPDKKIHNKSVFKRPFCDDFLQFCFDKFHVGIWSSRKRWLLISVLSYLFHLFSFLWLTFTWQFCTYGRTLMLQSKFLWGFQHPNCFLPGINVNVL